MPGEKNFYVLEILDVLLPEYGKPSSFGFDPWNEPNGFAVVADSESEARNLCAKYEFGGPWWLDEKLTSCTKVEQSGESRIVLVDQPTG